MPDIRSYFAKSTSSNQPTPKVQKVKVVRLDSSGSENESPVKRKEKSKSRNKRPKSKLLDSGSEDEITSKNNKDVSDIHSSKKSKQISPDDFFASSSSSSTASPSVKKRFSEIDSVKSSPPLKKHRSNLETKSSYFTNNDKNTLSSNQKVPQAATPEKHSPKLGKPNAALAEASPTPLSKSVSDPGAKRKSYFSYVNRQGPQHLGEKELPDPNPNALFGLTFVLTGVLEYVDRDNAASYIETCGGKVVKSISKKTSYIVHGREPGESKMVKGKQLGIKLLNEDEFFSFLESQSKKMAKCESAKTNSTKQLTVSNDDKCKISKKNDGSHSINNDNEINISNKEIQRSEVTSTSQTSLSTNSLSSLKQRINFKPDESVPAWERITSPILEKDASSSLMFVDRFRPTCLKQLVGQQGEKSNARKLLNWLSHWSNVHRKKAPFKGIPNKDTGVGFKAALLSGPPGVGKTTTAVLCCRALKLPFVERNASDSRSKSAVENAAEIVHSGSIEMNTSQVLIMDEVDGMSGDRGGIGALILMIKRTSAPIICLCNDRNHQKVRSLANYCFDLRFQRPRIEQLKAHILSVGCRVGVKVNSITAEQLADASGRDIRQCLHSLQSLSAGSKNATQAKRDVSVGVFDAARTIFTDEFKNANIGEALTLFFADYSLMPLFVAENYPYTCSGKKSLKSIAMAASSIAKADLISKSIRERGNWSLLPAQGMLGCVIPAKHCPSRNIMVAFPRWLGMNSHQAKAYRSLQTIGCHMRRKVFTSGFDLATTYLPSLRNMITNAVIDDRASDAVAIMNEYDLSREDMDLIADLVVWTGMEDQYAKAPSKLKAAFTRAYNKHSHQLPYLCGADMPAKRKTVAEYDDEDNISEEEDEKQSNVIPGVIAKKAKPAKTKTESSVKQKSKSNENPKKRRVAKKS